MPIYKMLSASLSGPVEFSDEEWARIEAAGKRPIDAEQRERIHDSCVTYLLLYHAAHNRISDAAIRKIIKAILRHSQALQTLLLPESENGPRNIALEMVGSRLRSPHNTLTQTYPAWDTIRDLARAADRALKDLPTMSAKVTTGPRDSGSFTYLVDELGKAFEAAGGKQHLAEPADRATPRSII